MEKCQEKLIVDAINACETNECRLAVIYLKQFMLANQAKPNCKVNLYDFCYKGDDRPSMSGIYHDKGYLISSEGHILAKIKNEYPKELEGKIITKCGEEINSKYPNYEAVMGKFDEMNDIFVSKEKAIESVKKLKIEKKVSGIQVLCKVGKQYFKPELLLKFLLLCESEKMQIREDKESGRAIMAKNSEDSEALLMPVYEYTDAIFIDCNK